MAGLVPAIHVFDAPKKGVDARDKRGHDGRRDRPIMPRLRLLVLQLLVAVVAVLIWHVGTTVPIGGVKLLPPFFFSTPGDVASRIVKWFVEGTIWRHLWITLVEAVLAFVIGSVAGILGGFRLGRQQPGTPV